MMKMDAVAKPLETKSAKLVVSITLKVRVVYQLNLDQGLTKWVVKTSTALLKPCKQYPDPMSRGLHYPVRRTIRPSYVAHYSEAPCDYNNRLRVFQGVRYNEKRPYVCPYAACQS